MMSRNSILTFIVGLGIGGAAGATATYFLCVKKVEKECDRQIQEMEDYYGAKDRYSRQTIAEDNDEINLVDEEEEVTGIKTDEEKQQDDIRKKLRYNHDVTTNYAAIYGNDDQNDEPEKTPEEEEAEEALQRDAERAAVADRAPRIISYEDACNVPDYIEGETLMYYTEAGVLADEDGNVIDDPERFIGDALDKYGFRNSDEDCIYVQNYELDTVYEIQKVYGMGPDSSEPTWD